MCVVCFSSLVIFLYWLLIGGFVIKLLFGTFSLKLLFGMLFFKSDSTLLGKLEHNCCVLFWNRVYPKASTIYGKHFARIFNNFMFRLFVQNSPILEVFCIPFDSPFFRMSLGVNRVVSSVFTQNDILICRCYKWHFRKSRMTTVLPSSFITLKWHRPIVSISKTMIVTIV